MTARPLPEPPGPEDDHGDWPDRLLKSLAAAPLVPEDALVGLRYQHDYARSELSAAEVRVLLAASHGLTNEMIGSLHFISKETVKTHMSRCIGVLNAKNRTHAVAIALRQGMIE